MARRFKENKYITNTILFFIIMGVLAEIIQYIIIILIVFAPVYVCYRWLKK